MMMQGAIMTSNSSSGSIGCFDPTRKF